MNPDTSAVPFAVVRRGYDRAQVEESFSRLTAELDSVAVACEIATENVHALTRQLDASSDETKAAKAASATAHEEVERLKAKVVALSTIPDTVDGMSERLQQLVRIAQDEVNDMRSRATTTAAQVLTMAQAEADELRDRSKRERREFEEERRAAEESLQAQLAESQVRLDELRNDSAGQRARLDQEVAEQRAQAEEAFNAEMQQRRAALLNELADTEARARDEAGRVVQAADQEAQYVRGEARNGMAAAQRELEDLRALQHQVAEQLTSVRALLDWTLPQIGVASGPAGHVAEDLALPGPRSALFDEPAVQPEVRPAEAVAETPADQAEDVEPGHSTPTPGPHAPNGEQAEAGRSAPPAQHAKAAGPTQRGDAGDS